MKFHSLRTPVCAALFTSLFTSIAFAQVTSFVPNRAALGGTDFIDWQSHDDGEADGQADYTFIDSPADIISDGGGIPVTVMQQAMPDSLILQDPTPSGLFRPTNFPDGEYFYSTNIIFNAYNPIEFSDFDAQGVCGLGTQIAPRLPGPFTAMIEGFDASNNSMGYFMVDGHSEDPSAAFIGIESTAPMSRVKVEIVEVGDSDFALGFFAINRVDFKSCAHAQVPVVACEGFDAPMAIYPVKAKKNRVFPLKMKLFDDAGFELTDVELTAGPVVEVIFTASEESALSVDLSGDVLYSGQGTDGNQFVFTDDDTWQFNLKSRNYTASGEYLVTAVSGDDSEYVIEPSCVSSFVIE